MSICIRWVGGAGFIIEYDGVCIGIDLYLSNSCMDSEGNFKRLIPIPEDPKKLKMDFLIATHEHGDHLDQGCIDDWFSGNRELRLVGSSTALKEAKTIPENQKLNLDRGDELVLSSNIIVNGVFCDHGDQSPDCIGVLLTLGNKTIYFTSDTCYRPDLQELTGINRPDVLLVPINPAFGNPGADGAAKLTKMFSPGIVIPCHYWLFKEHGGDPAEFERELQKTSPEMKSTTLAIGEKITI